MDRKSIKIAHWNANGLQHKWAELQNFIIDNEIDIMLVNESKLPKNKNIFLNGFKLYRQDRQGTNPGGGLVILIKNNIEHREINIDLDFHTVEALGILLEDNLAIYSVYARPTKDNKTNTIDPTELDKILKSSSRVIAIGDYNAKHNTWNCKRSNKNGQIIHKLINNSQYTILAPDNYTLHPTNNGLPSIVDFALANNINSPHSIEAINDLDSDHLPIILKLNDRIQYNNHYLLNYKKANWKQFRSILNNDLIINNKLNTKTDIDDSINNLTKIINKAKNEAVPKIKITPRINQLPDTIKQLIKDRNTARRKYQRTRISSYKIEKNRLSNLVNREIKHHLNDSWNKKLENLKIKDNSIWKTAKTFTKRNDSNIPTLHGPNGLVFSDSDKANVLAQNFEKVHHLTELDGDEDFEKIVQDTYNTIKSQPIDENSIQLTSPSEISQAIKKTKSTKAPGPDEIQNILLKNLPKKALVQLTHIFNQCF